MARKKSRGRTRTIGLDLNKMKHEVRRALLEAGFEVVGELAEKVAELANEKAPVDEEILAPDYFGSVRRGPNKSGGSDSGPLKGAIFATESQKVPWSYLVVAPAWYAHFVEYGTDSHPIPKPNNTKAKTLVFSGTNEYQGQVIKVKKLTHDHPGAKRHPFLRPAADEADSLARVILREKGFLKT